MVEKGKFVRSRWNSRWIEMMLKPLELTNCVFRCNHASNYLPLKGTLPGDKKNLLQTLASVLHSGNSAMLRPEYLRGL